MNGRLVIDRYAVFLTLVFSGLALLTIGLLAVGVWLWRRNRRLPRLVKPRRNTTGR
jgi:hypothetical protein